MIGHALDRRSKQNRIRGPLNAWMLERLDGLMHHHYGTRKERLFQDLPEMLVELGPGAGANFRYLKKGTRVIALEPNAAMHAPLARAAGRREIALELRPSSATESGLPDASVDAVLASLVLCTVPDPASTLREVLRILKPGGRFVCLEHVAAPPGSGLARVQRLSRRPWGFFFEGCEVDRDTAATLTSAGFSNVALERFSVDTLVVPLRPHIAAVAVK